MDNNKEPLIDLDAAKDLLKLSKRTIYTYISERRIPYYKFKTKVMFCRTELIDWQYQQRQKTSKELDYEALRYCRTH